MLLIVFAFFWIIIGFTFTLWVKYRVKVNLFLKGTFWILSGPIGWSSFITAYFLKKVKPNPIFILVFNIFVWILFIFSLFKEGIYYAFNSLFF